MGSGDSHCTDHDLLIQVSERLIALSDKFDEFTTTNKEQQTFFRQDLDLVKNQNAQARGAVALLYLIATLSGLYAVVFR